MEANQRFEAELLDIDDQIQEENKKHPAYLIMDVFEQFVEVHNYTNKYGSPSANYYMPPNLKWKWLHVRKDTSKIEEVS